MARLSEEQAEQLRSLTVEMILEVRRAYLASGASPLKHWDQLQNRALSSARRASSADEWVTMLCRGLQLPALSSSASRALLDLTHAVREMGAAGQWLSMLDREIGLVMALARVSSEERRAARESVDPQTGEVRDE